MISVAKDLSCVINTYMYDDNYYIIRDIDLEDKIMRGFPNIEWILDEQGRPIDVKFTVPVIPTLPEQVDSLVEENQMLVDCILEMSEIIYGGE